MDSTYKATQAMQEAVACFWLFQTLLGSRSSALWLMFADFDMYSRDCFDAGHNE